MTTPTMIALLKFCQRTWFEPSRRTTMINAPIIEFKMLSVKESP